MTACTICIKAEFWTVEEATNGFRKTRRWLQDFLRDNPADLTGTPFYRKAGRTILFTEADLLRIYKALPCPSTSSRRAKANRRASQSGVRTSGSTLTEALALASERPPQ